MKHHVNRRKLRASIGLHTLLTVLSILWMLPVFWLLISSFRKEPGAYTPYLWPKSFTLLDFFCQIQSSSSTADLTGVRLNVIAGNSFERS